MGYYSPIGEWHNINPVEPVYVTTASASSHILQIRGTHVADTTVIPAPIQAKSMIGTGIQFGIPLLTLNPETQEYEDNRDVLIFRTTNVETDPRSDRIIYNYTFSVAIYNLNNLTEQTLFSDVRGTLTENSDTNTYFYYTSVALYTALYKNDNDEYVIGFAPYALIERSPRNHPDQIQYVSQNGQGVCCYESMIPQGYKLTISGSGDDDPNKDPENPGDEEKGGGGSHDKPREAVPIPSLPTIGAAGAGFLTLYHLSSAEMWVFGQDCVASNIWESIRLFFSNPMDFIAGCSIVPFTPTGNSQWYPKFGTSVFQHGYAKVDNQYVEINCGTLYIEPFFGSFLDYAPYTRIGIWLPYIGYRELNVDEVMGTSITVVYHCDCLSGDCVAFISTSAPAPGAPAGPQIPVVLAQFTGNCAVQVPFASAAFDTLISNSVGMLTNALPAVMGVKESIPAALKDMTDATHAQTGDVQRGGNVGGSNGLMGVQNPYIVRRVPIENIPSQFMSQKGYPSNISGTLSEFSGYAEVDEIQLNNIPAMETEREEIKQLLREGVLL